MRIEVKATKCINKCKADPTRQYCLGCGRTMKEIVEKGLRERDTTRNTGRPTKSGS